DGYRFKFDVPGVARDAIHIDVEDRVLTVTGERSDAREQKEGKEAGKVWRRERFYGKFTRAFQLPTDADAASISAHYEDGVLEVSVPKTEAVKARRVEISG
ncbi:MAG: HSP20 family protein, partial [Hyphomicrobiaceae bacterium]